MEPEEKSVVHGRILLVTKEYQMNMLSIQNAFVYFNPDERFLSANWSHASISLTRSATCARFSVARERTAADDLGGCIHGYSHHSFVINS